MRKIGDTVTIIVKNKIRENYANVIVCTRQLKEPVEGKVDEWTLVNKDGNVVGTAKENEMYDTVPEALAAAIAISTITPKKE